jgi:hypothetical protein
MAQDPRPHLSRIEILGFFLDFGFHLFGGPGIWPFDSLQPQIETQLILLQLLAGDGFS